jgi:K(+)-stimulated pyrophosphate-energized sodium pump
MEIAIAEEFCDIAPYVGYVFLAVALVFVWRSFYRTRITK